MQWSFFCSLTFREPHCICTIQIIITALIKKLYKRITNSSLFRRKSVYMVENDC